MSSSGVQIKFNIDSQEKKRLTIDDQDFKELDEFRRILFIGIKKALPYEDGAFENAENISNVLMNKLLSSFKTREIFNNFIQNAQCNNFIRSINFQIPKEFSGFVIFFEKLSNKQQEIFLNFLETIHAANLFQLKPDNDLFASAEYIQMIINIFSNKYKNIDSFYKKLVEASGFTSSLTIEKEIELNKIINDETFKKFFEFFLKDCNQEELEEIGKQDLEAFLNSDDFKNKKDIEKQPYLVDITDDDIKAEARNKKEGIISCMQKKAKIIQTFFEKKFDEKQNISENKLLEINDKITKKPDSKKKNPNHTKTLITGFALIAVDALLLGVLAKKSLPNLFENRMINLGLIICSSMLLIAAEALIVKKVYNLEIENIDNLESNKVQGT